MRDKAILGLKNWQKLKGRQNTPELRAKIKTLAADLNDNLMIMISGEFNAGKSTFINAILGEKVLTTDITPATAIITKLTYGTKKKVIAHYIDGSTQEYKISWVEQLTAEREGEGEAIRNRLSFVEYQLPIELLKKYTLIDSPGLTALHEHHSKVTESFMERADIAIWLFNSLSVGTASELSWLKKMYSLEVPIYGVVNAIDRIEEEDLESFLEYNVRRLQPYISRLHGVSARDILNGKLEHDAEKIDWGNGEALDELFKQFEPVQFRKMEEFYRKLRPSLEEQYVFLKKKKLSFKFIEDISKLKKFQKSTYPKFLELTPYFAMSQGNYQSFYNEWNRFIYEKTYTENFTEEIISNLIEAHPLKKQWIYEIKPLIEKSHIEYEKLLKDWNELKEFNKKINFNWYRARSPFLTNFKKTKVYKQELQYNQLAEDWNVRNENFKNEYKKLEKVVLIFNKEVMKRVNKEIFKYHNKMSKAAKQLSELKSDAYIEFGEVKPMTIKHFKNHIVNVEFLRSQILPQLEEDSPWFDDSSSYYQVKSLSANIESLYQDIDYLDFINNFTALTAYNVSVTSFESLSFDSIPVISYKKNLLSNLYLSLKSSKHTKTNPNIFNGKVIAIVVFISMAHVYNYYEIGTAGDNSVDYDNTSYNDSKNESDYYVNETSTSVDKSADNSYETEETEDITDLNDEPEEVLVEDPVIEETVHLADVGYIKAFMEMYRADYENALNYEDFSIVSAYFSSHEPIYPLMLDYVDSIEGEGLKFDFTSLTFTSIEEIDVNQYSIKTEEEFYLTDNDDGRESYNERTKQYIIAAVRDNTFVIEDIITLDQSTEMLESSSIETDDEFTLTGETISFVTRENVSQMMEQYYMDLEIAFNENGFSYIEDYYAYDGKEYATTAAYIERAHRKNMVMINHSVIVENVEIYDDNHYLATLYIEDEYHYQEGNGDTKKIRADYLIRITPDGTMEIQEIKDFVILEKVEF